jgi:hypothetical protein
MLKKSVQDNPHIGSSTVVIAKFDNVKDNYIKTLNLGDSGYMILRPNKNRFNSGITIKK